MSLSSDPGNCLKGLLARAVAAWAPADRQLWSQRRMSSPTWVADVDGKAIGFTDLEPDGHLDMMYVDPQPDGEGAVPSTNLLSVLR